MKHLPTFRFILVLACAMTCSCSGVHSPVDTPPALQKGDSTPRIAAPDSEHDTVWGYLEANYDKNGDGVISAQEYTRNRDQFFLWDSDADGVLSASDFSSVRDQAGFGPAGAGSGRAGGRMSLGRARRTLARYFQVDEEAGLLPLVEAQEAFALFDGADGSQPDGRLSEGEFLVLSTQRLQAVPGDELPRVQSVMGDFTPWQALTASLDRDGDQELTLMELQSFYDDVMETDTIDYRDWGDRFFAGPDSEPKADGLAAQEGRLAPDFTLSSPDGKHTYRLQDFRGHRPVALIFGSYT